MLPNNIRRTIMMALSCVLLTDNTAVANDAAAVQIIQVAQSCTKVRSAMDSTQCPWKWFTDQFSGATIAFPADLFTPTSVPPKAANEALVWAYGEMIVAIWSTRTKTSMSMREAMAADIYRSGFTTVTRRDAYKTGYTISGTIGARSLLKRRIFSGSRKRTITTFCVTWPSDAGDNWPHLATAISQTLKPGKARTIAKFRTAPRRKNRITACQGL